MSTDLSIYLEPIKDQRGWMDDFTDSSIGYFIKSHIETPPDMEGVQLAIVGIREGRNTDENEGCANAADAVRRQLYPLFTQKDDLAIADLGDIKAGHSIEDTIFAVEQVATELVKRSIIPIFIGGADYCSLAIYRAYCKLERMTNIVSIDPMFDVDDKDGPLDSYNHLSRCILHKPGFLFNWISNLSR
jgi:formiminoglutamase